VHVLEEELQELVQTMFYIHLQMEVLRDLHQTDNLLFVSTELAQQLW